MKRPRCKLQTAKSICISKHEPPLRTKYWKQGEGIVQGSCRLGMKVPWAANRPVQSRHLIMRLTTTTCTARPHSIPPFQIQAATMAAKPSVNGHLSSIEALRHTTKQPLDLVPARRTLAVPESEDDRTTRATYRPFLHSVDVASCDWIAKLELTAALKMAEADLERSGGERLKVMVLFGSLRSR